MIGREKMAFFPLLFSLKASLTFLFKTHVKHNEIILKQDNKKAGFSFGAIRLY